MKHGIFFLILCINLTAGAQDATVKKLQSEADKKIKNDATDTAQRTWKKGGIYNLNIAQGSLSNWAAGGENFSLSLNSVLSLFAFYKKGKYSWDNTLDFSLGYVKTSSLGSRKNDDRFDLLSKYGYALHSKLNASALFNFRTQLFKGYIYPGNVKIYTSNFLAPGYILLSLGLDYKPTKNLSIFISPATARWVIVKDTTLANKGLYGVSPGTKDNFEFGAFASINYLKEFNKYVNYKGRLDLFSNYRRHPGKIDVYMSNLLSLKLSKIFSLTWSLDMIYDDDLRIFGPNRNSPALQLKSFVGLGVLVKF